MKSVTSVVLCAMMAVSLSFTPAQASHKFCKSRFRRLYRITGEGSEREIHWDRPMMIKIGVMEAQSAISFTCRSAYRLVCGPRIYSAPAGAVWTIRKKRSIPAERLFWPIVETVLNKDAQRLEQVKNRWRRLGHKVTVFPAGARLFYRGALIHDNRRWYVSVEPSAEQTAAEDLFQSLQAHDCKPWVFETITRPAAGVMQLFDGDGALVADLDEPVSLSAAEPIKVFRVEYGVGYPWHGFQDRRFRGTLEIRIDKVGKLQLINALDIEYYLQGVVPSEMSAGYPLQALCAQAIAARGETLSKFGTRHLSDPYDLCATQHCQVYGGLTKEHETTNKAVQSTRGKILKHGALIADTVYSACCGGHTENNDFVWSTEPSDALRGVPCLSPGAQAFPDPPTEEALKHWWSIYPAAWCRLDSKSSRERFRWKRTFTVAQLSALVAKKYPQVGRVIDLIPVSRGVSGRLRELKITGDKASVLVQKELPIRLLFGGLYSAAFVVDRKRDLDGNVSAFTFIGGGWGHGVGMCQWGARGQAMAGRNYRQILSGYFSDTFILDIYSLDNGKRRRR